MLRIDLLIRQQRLATELSQHLSGTSASACEEVRMPTSHLGNPRASRSQRALLAYLEEYKAVTARRLQQRLC